MGKVYYDSTKFRNFFSGAVWCMTFPETIYLITEIHRYFCAVQGSRMKLEYYPDSGQCTIDIK